MRKIDCPWGGFIALPDEWLGEHARRRDEAAQKAADNNLPATFRRFAIAMALLADWGGLPGFDGNPEAWVFDEKSWPVMEWVSDTTFADLTLALRVPKKSSEPSQTGLTATAGTNPPGDSESGSQM